MANSLSKSIRVARQRAGLTQQALAMRLGLKARAVSRWERNDSAPRRRHRVALLNAIAAVNPDVARELALAMQPPAATAEPAAAAPPPVDKGAAVELAVFRLADELDLPSRRVRRPLVRLLKRLLAVPLSLPEALSELEATLAADTE